MKLEEDLYQRLNVDRRATTSEIAAAYHAARAAFSKDSLAAYSLLESSASEAALQQLEEAYLVLTNSEKRRAYDENRGIEVTPSHPLASASAVKAEGAPSSSPPSTSHSYDAQGLRKIREQLGHSVRDVSRITKIPVRFLDAIEENRPQELPARVYLQGFIRNLAQFYRLDPIKTLQEYLRSLDQNKDG